MTTNGRAPIATIAAPRAPHVGRAAEAVIARAFADYAAARRWVSWRLVPDDPKPKKVPYSPRSGAGTGTNAAHEGEWGTLPDALGAMRRRRHAGVGLVVPEGVVCVDLDHCAPEPFGPLDPWARDIVERLDTFTEYSPSGTGVHVWCRATKSGARCRPLPGATTHVEVYEGPYGRYITCTGRPYGRWGELPIAARTDALAGVYADYLDAPAAAAAPIPTLATTAPAAATPVAAPPAPTHAAPVEAGGRVPPSALTDAEVLDAAHRGARGAERRALWDGAAAALARYGDDQSRAEAALATHLVWWCGGDAARAERLMGAAPLCARAKWQERADYRARTMALAAGGGGAWEGPTRREVGRWWGSARAAALFGPVSARGGRAGDRVARGGTSGATGAVGDPEAAPGAVPDPTPPSADDGPHAGPDGYALTDGGNAERLAARAGARLAFNPAIGRGGAWMWWNETLWEVDTHERRIGREAQEMARRLWVDAIRPGVGEAAAKAMRAHATRSESRRGIADAVRRARDIPGMWVDPDEVDADPGVIVVARGVVDLKSLTLSRHADYQGRYLTRGTWHMRPDGRRILADYVPGVTPGSHPLWERFLARVQPDPEVRAYLRRAAGLSLSGWNRDAIHIHVGTGANGKSTFLETLRKAFGPDYSYVVKRDAVMASSRDDGRAATPYLAALRGRRFVVIAEGDAADRLDEATMKAITSHGEMISARPLYGDPVEFVPTHTAHLHSNHRPIVRGTDEGLWRRIHLIPWEVTIPEAERDEGLKEALAAPDVQLGVLAWAAEGAREVARDGLRPPARVVYATREYRAESDVVGQWMEERAEIGPGVGPTPGGALYADHRAWCEANGLRPRAGKAFAADLKRLGLERPSTTGRDRYSWAGISLVGAGP